MKNISYIKIHHHQFSDDLDRFEDKNDKKVNFWASEKFSGNSSCIETFFRKLGLQVKKLANAKIFSENSSVDIVL